MTHLQLFNFLPLDLLNQIRHIARERQALFQPTTVSPPRPDGHTVRASTVLHARHYPAVEDAFRQQLWPQLPWALKTLGIRLPQATLETQLVAHHDGHYFRRHIDRGRGGDSDPASRRRVSFVYYFDLDGERFSGGELKLYRGLCYQLRRVGWLRIFNPFPTVVQPTCNSIVFFDATMTHEVTEVQCADGWQNGRFALTGWLLDA